MLVFYLNAIQGLGRCVLFLYNLQTRLDGAPNSPSSRLEVCPKYASDTYVILSIYNV